MTASTQDNPVNTGVILITERDLSPRKVFSNISKSRFLGVVIAGPLPLIVIFPADGVTVQFQPAMTGDLKSFGLFSKLRDSPLKVRTAEISDAFAP